MSETSIAVRADEVVTTPQTFFVQKSEDVMDTILGSAPLMKLYPEIYGPRFDAIADIRRSDDGSLYRGSAFRHVASFVNIPLFNAATTLLNPEFMKDKRQFYGFLRRNREFCTYDIRQEAVGNPDIHTFIDGKPA